MRRSFQHILVVVVVIVVAIVVVAVAYELVKDVFDNWPVGEKKFSTHFRCCCCCCGEDSAIRLTIGQWVRRSFPHIFVVVAVVVVVAIVVAVAVAVEIAQHVFVVE